MNHDDQVDDLLKDLDRALSIEPSPAVVAKVRAKISNERTSIWAIRSWPFIAAAVTASVVLVSYVMWPRATLPAAPVTKSATVLEPTPRTAELPAVAARTAPSVVARRTAAPKTLAAERPVAAIDEVEPDNTVLVPASSRLALEQFTAAAHDGRITEASFSNDVVRAPNVQVQVEKVTFEVIAIEKVAIELVPAVKAGSPQVR